MKEMTDKQKHCLELIIKYKSEKGYSPTLRELGDLLGVNQGAALSHVKLLAKKGYIHYSSNVARSIVVLKLSE